MQSAINIGNQSLIYDKYDRITVSDFLRRDSVTLQLQNDKLLPEDTLIQGNFYRKQLRKGLFLHGSDTIEKHAFTIDSVINEGLSCMFFFKGDVYVTIGNQLFSFNNPKLTPIKAAAVIKTSQEPFQRVTKQTQHVRYLVISATSDWLASECMGEVYNEKLVNLCQHGMKSLQLTLTQRLHHLLGEILMPKPFSPSLLNLYLESRIIEIVTEVIATILACDKGDNKPIKLSRHDTIRLQRAQDFISGNLNQQLNVGHIAQEAGVSSSGLQRLFRQSKGQSVFEYIRSIRMEHALSILQKDAVSVQEASAIAGYSNPANFATAFKRQFGMTPREAALQNSLR